MSQLEEEKKQKKENKNKQTYIQTKDRNEKSKDGIFHPKATASTNPFTCSHTFCLFLMLNLLI